MGNNLSRVFVRGLLIAFSFCEDVLRGQSRPVRRR